MLLTTALTTGLGLAVTLLTHPEDHVTLDRFYKQVRPAPRMEQVCDAGTEATPRASLELSALDSGFLACIPDALWRWKHTLWPNSVGRFHDHRQCELSSFTSVEFK
jgi:hypothetical protein